MPVNHGGIPSPSVDHALESVLADVPFISAGILSIGVLTFLLLMRRLDWLAICLHLSVIIAFVASILDLSQILIRGSRATDFGLDLATVTGLITVREVGFALSVGLRFLFFWGFVSEPPPGEVAPDRNQMHNGSWARWGYLGMGLKWSTLSIIIAVPVLQILFRDVQSLHKLGPVYEVDSTIEIVLSAVFILKLLLNSWILQLANPDAIPGKRVVVLYSPMIAALLLGLWVAVGNILSFEFSETVFGRILQAIELYIIVLYTLVAAFYHLRKVPSAFTPSSPFIGRYTPFQGLPPLNSTGPSFRISPPMVSTPSVGSVVQRAAGVELPVQMDDKDNTLLRPPPPRRASTTSRISSWLNNRRISHRNALNSGSIRDADADDARLWDQDEAERGDSSPVKRGYDVESFVDEDDTPRTFNQSLSRAQETATWRDPTSTAILPQTGFSIDSMASPSARSRFVKSSNQPESVVSPSAGSRSTRSPVDVDKTPYSSASRRLSISVAPTMVIPRVQDSGSVETPPSAYASPKSAISSTVRGAGGGGLRVPALRRGSDESSRISELIRQQLELERSIAALRLFSPDPELREVDAERRVSASSGSQSRTIEHSATQSEFSLSNFPEPPWGRASNASSITISQERSTSEEGARLGADSGGDRTPTPSILEPPLIPAAIDELMNSGQVPSTYEDDTLAPRTRTGSSGTAYEITSFIGHLTSPAHRKDLSQSTINLNSEDEGAIGRPMGLSDSNWTTQTPRVPHSPSPDSDGLGPSASRPFAAAPDRRFVRPIGLPPRPRLVSRDPLTPVEEG